MNTLKKIFAWIVYSSSNAEKISLTLKGVFVGALPTIIAVAGLANVSLDSEALTQAVNSIATLIQIGGYVVSTVMILVGAVRKVWTSIRGENAVIASFNG